MIYVYLHIYIYIYLHELQYLGDVLSIFTRDCSRFFMLTMYEMGGYWIPTDFFGVIHGAVLFKAPLFPRVR